MNRILAVRKSTEKGRPLLHAPHAPGGSHNLDGGPLPKAKTRHPSLRTQDEGRPAGPRDQPLTASPADGQSPVCGAHEMPATTPHSAHRLPGTGVSKGQQEVRTFVPP